MVPNPGDSSFPTPSSNPSPNQSGFRTVLQYTGIPPSWFSVLQKRPKLPSRNWLIFLSVSSSLLSYYVYDRRECKKIRQEYQDKVKYLAEVPLHSLDMPRKVMVYGAKWPSDEESDRSLKYFKKYVKPILVAAAIDYQLVTGRRHGDLTRHISSSIISRRRIEAGLDSPPPNPLNLPTLTLSSQRERELKGGIVIVGRPTFKEFMEGMKRGWTGSLVKRDEEEELARMLEEDKVFDEPETVVDSAGNDSARAGDGTLVDLGDLDKEEPIPTVSKLPPSNNNNSQFSAFTPPHLRSSASTTSSPSSLSQKTNVDPASLVLPPSILPPHPPLLLVDFINHVGIPQIPHMLWDFFNERFKVRSGAETAYKLVMNVSRPFVFPSFSSSSDATFLSTDSGITSSSSSSGSSSSSTGSGGGSGIGGEETTDLTFAKPSEIYYKSSFQTSFISSISQARSSYYSTLPSRLSTARALSRNERQPTRDERNFPPPTEVELRAERLKKELRWRRDEDGWEVVNEEKEVAWDERFRGVLRVFVDPEKEEGQNEVWGKGEKRW